MSYLTKIDRKNQILDAAMEIALVDGLNTLTVRNLAQRASLSIGLIHHYFKTIQELKCEVFMQLIYKNLDISQMDDNLSLREKILWGLGFSKSEEELPYIRLWNDAEKNSHISPEFKKTFSIAIEEWHKLVKKILGLAAFKSHQENPDDIAWQLIGITLGLEALAKIHPHLFTYEYMTQLVTCLIENKVNL